MTESGFSMDNVVSTKDQLVNPITISKKYEEQPGLIATKENDPNGRIAIAEKALQSREEQQSIRKEISLTEAEQVDRSNSLVGKLKEILHLPDKKSLSLTEKLRTLKEKEGKIPSARELIDTYYEKIKERPLTTEEKKELLKPEVLAELSTDEYITLWKRLNPQFLAHTTKQGFQERTQINLSENTAIEFKSNFVDTMEDGGKLRSFYGTIGLRGRDTNSVTNFLKNSGVLDQENIGKAKEKFQTAFIQKFDQYFPRYVDSSSIHFTPQSVNTKDYGAESGNEIFYCFPSDVLASQYNYALPYGEKTLLEAQGERVLNDVFVWPNTVENPGILVNSGVVLIPENTLVDKQTGSKYASEVKLIDGKEKRIIVEKTELKNNAIELVKNFDENSPIIKMLLEARNNHNEYDVIFQENLESECYREFENIGLDKDSINFVLPEFIRQLHYWDNVDTNIDITKVFDNNIAFYQLSENTIPAKSYWEEFFSKNPDLKPKHIIYYNGNPTNAVHNLLRENNIGSENKPTSKELLLGFDDHHQENLANNQIVIEGYQELLDLSNKIITKHYQTNELPK